MNAVRWLNTTVAGDTGAETRKPKARASAMQSTYETVTYVSYVWNVYMDVCEKLAADP